MKKLIIRPRRQGNTTWIADFAKAYQGNVLFLRAHEHPASDALKDLENVEVCTGTYFGKRTKERLSGFKADIVLIDDALYILTNLPLLDIVGEQVGNGADLIMISSPTVTYDKQLVEMFYAVKKNIDRSLLNKSSQDQVISMKQSALVLLDSIDEIDYDEEHPISVTPKMLRAFPKDMLYKEVVGQFYN